MRTIKFRAWYEYNQEMRYWDRIKTSPMQVMQYASKIKYMQFTGLLDKNGKEIYEGDILKVPDDWETYGFMAGEIREIAFHDGGFRFKSKKENQRGHYLEDNNEFEIIGNIYENPELLSN